MRIIGGAVEREGACVQRWRRVWLVAVVWIFAFSRLSERGERRWDRNDMNMRG